MGESCKRPSEGARNHILTWARKCLRCAIVLLLVTLAPSAQAEPQHRIAGAEAPAFEQALSLWLNADEAESLPRLAGLAQEGNVAARFLLAMIDKTAALQGPYLTHLPRAERIALLRQPGGLSGRNWMQEAAAKEPLAELWNDLWLMRGGVEIAEGFAALGEERACRESLLAQISRQESGFAPETLAAPWYPESLPHLTLTRTLDLAGIDSLPAGHPLRALGGQAPEPAELTEWLGTAPLAAPLRAACSSVCPESAASCAYVLYQALGSYHSLAMMGSPSVALVPEEAFIASPRGHQAVARRIMLMHPARVREASYSKLARTDACAADWLRAHYKAYHPVIRASPVAPN